MISVHHSNHRSFVDLHTESIIGACTSNRTKYNIIKLNKITLKYFSKIPFIKGFEQLVRASPRELMLITKYFDKKPKAQQDEINKKLSVKTLYNDFNSPIHHENNKLKVKYNASYLASATDIRSCPYCNEQYTYSFSYNSKNGTRRTFDWDHIYPSSRYSFLAVSFFNLTPACKVCNQIKSNSTTAITNPFQEFNPNNIYFFDLKPTGPNFVYDLSQFELNIIFKRSPLKKELRALMKEVGILSRYRLQKQLIQDALIKQIWYKEKLLNALDNQLNLSGNGGFVNPMNTYYGIAFDSKDYYKRPFSKLLRDVLSKPHSL